MIESFVILKKYPLGNGQTAFLKQAVNLGLGLLLFFVFAGLFNGTAIYGQGNDDIFGLNEKEEAKPAPVKPAVPESVAKTKTESKAAGGQLTEFDDPKKREKAQQTKDIPRVDKLGNMTFERIEDKDPNKMTEEEFNRTLTAAEQVVLTNPPKTGADWFRAGAIIARVGRPAFARILLKKALDSPSTPEEYAAVLTDIGSDRLMYLATRPELEDIGKTSVLKVLSEAKKAWENPQVIQAAVRQYEQSTIESERVQALQTIRKGADVSIACLIELLRTVPDDKVGPIAELIGFMETDGTEALLSTMDTKDPKLLKRIVEILGQTPSLDIPDILLAFYYDETFPKEIKEGAMKTALMRQFGRIPDQEEAFNRFYTKTVRFYRRDARTPYVVDGHLYCWIWDESTKKLNRKDWDIDNFYRDLSFYWARHTYQTAKSWKNKKRNAAIGLAMVTLAEKILYDRGLDKPMDTELFTREFPNPSSEDLQRALLIAITEKRPRGGIIPLVLMGLSGDRSLCYGQSEPSPLIQAATSPDRRLRFTALAALVRLNPDKAFMGSSRILPSLIEYSNSTGAKSMIIAAPQLEEALKYGDIFTKLNYIVIPATTGNEVLRLAQKDPDVELIVGLANIKKPDMLTVTQALACDYRTADTPVLVGADTAAKFFIPGNAEYKMTGDKPLYVSREDGRGVVIKSYSPGDIYITRLLWALKIREQKIDPALAEKEEYKNTSPVINDSINEPVLIGMEVLTDMPRAQKAGGQESNAIALPLPWDPKSALWTIQQLKEKTGIEPVPANIRYAQAKIAAQWIALLYTAHPEIYVMEDIEFIARSEIVNPYLRKEGLQLALAIPTPSIQIFMTQLIGDGRYPLEVRREILNTYKAHLQKYGCKMRGPEIKDMYKRYNASEKEDPSMQKILSDMLDIYEQTKK